MYPGIQEPAVENMPSPAHIRFDCNHICHFLSYIRKSYHERTDKFVGIYYGGKILALDGKKVYNEEKIPGGATMATEYELKFKADPQTLSAMDVAFPGGNRMEMETAYYDTPTGKMSARRYTLRRRLENGISVCTLKTPAGDARGEWETECDTIETAIPKLIEMGAPAELGDMVKEGLVHICGAKFTRLLISLPECTVEIALDQGILLGGGKTEPLCEAEVELKDGEKAVCDAFAAELAAKFGLVTEKKSKFARALGLYKGE